jgi:hypothetical protein
VAVQLLMSFLETTQPAEGAPPVWPTLERAQKEEIVAMLARLIAEAAVQSKVHVAEQEAHDE